MNVELLKELGMDAAADNLQEKITLKQKLLVAYEHFKFVEPHIFERFQTELRNKTQRKDPDGYTRFDTIKFIGLSSYTEIPPPDCLQDLKKAKDLNIFDKFEVAKVETVEVRPDPIIFGSITGCVDKFFITQWDDDVKIEDILREGEG